MTSYRIPYGKDALAFNLDDSYTIDVIAPRSVPGTDDPRQRVQEALNQTRGGVVIGDFQGARTAAIAINDNTRPVPHQQLLPPLLGALASLGIRGDDTTLLIATGAHKPMAPDAFSQVVPADILPHYPVLCHDCDDEANLIALGSTTRGTPVWVNRRFREADLRIVVGNIEPHQFQGYSGGVKSAAIGLAGRATINHNHALMTQSEARLGIYQGNPAREDVEEIGKRIGVHFALNAILNDKKEIVSVLAGDPAEVMIQGIPQVQGICQVRVQKRYEIVIASPGGHPKDINLYQAQKALAHAALITQPGGTIVLVAACQEGTGSASWENWMENKNSQEAVIASFKQEGFRVGPHKAYQIARDAVGRQVWLLSEMDPRLVRNLLLRPIASLTAVLSEILPGLALGTSIALMPKANVTIPIVL